MTKPKTVSALLTEANKLARERRMGEVNLFRYPEGVTGHIATLRGNGRGMCIWHMGSELEALRCLIAALREVPVTRK